MTKIPPLLPAEILLRVLRTAKFDGTTVLVLAGGLALLSAAAGDFTGAVIGILVAAAGAAELHGATLLKVAEPRGVNWLVGSQLYLLAIVLAYVGWRLLAYDPEQVKRFLDTVMTEHPEMQAQLDAGGATQAELRQMLGVLYRALYLIVGVVTLIYQGGMARYYHRRRAAVTAALAEA